jgi:UDP-N-acetylglucosamine 2-epimerase (non-hydrolysing)
MAKTSVLCVIGTRPEVIKIAPVVLELQRHADRFDTRIMVTAQHRQMLDQMMTVFGLQADVDLDIMRPNQTLKDVTCRVLHEMESYLAENRPDVVLAQGDTTTVMATATACFYTHTAFGHIEAGLRTGDCHAPYPEEFNRRVAALVARYHFAPTPSAAANLHREGLCPSTVFVTGNSVIDALKYVIGRTVAPPRPVPAGAPYILMTCHRREIFGDQIREVFETVRDFARARPDVYVWYPVHPNPNVSGPAREILGRLPNVVLTEPLDYVAFLHAMNGAYLIVSDSGGVQEEAPALGKPVLVLRDVTERPEGVEAGTCLLVGPHRDRIESALARLFGDRAAYETMARAKNPYGDGRTAERIVAILRGETPQPWAVG